MSVHEQSCIQSGSKLTCGVGIQELGLLNFSNITLDGRGSLKLRSVILESVGNMF